MGPSQASPGATATYSVEVTNGTAGVVQDALLRIAVPAGLTYIDSRPEARATGAELVWQLDSIPPGGTQSVAVDFQIGGRGTIDVCSSLSLSSGATVRDCASTRIAAPGVELQLSGPDQAQVGANVRFRVVVTNSGAAPATGLTITDTFEEGLEHVRGASPIERSLGTLDAGASTSVYVNFRVTKAGRLCHTVEIRGDGGVREAARQCINAAPAAGPSAPADRPPTESQAAIDVKKQVDAKTRHVGERAEFKITVTNTGDVPVTGLRITDTYELALRPTDATEGFDPPRPGDEQLLWRLARLEPGRIHTLQVQCDCVAPTGRACNHVVVTCDQHPPIATEACLRILPAETPSAAPPDTSPGTSRPEPSVPRPAPPSDQPSPSPLDLPADAPPADGAPRDQPDTEAGPELTSNLGLTIADLGDPVYVGGQAKYQVLIKNLGEGIARDVELNVRFPSDLTPAESEFRTSLDYRLGDGELRFATIPEVLPGETVALLIVFHTHRVARADVVAEVQSPGLARAITVGEQTDIVDAPVSP